MQVAFDPDSWKELIKLHNFMSDRNVFVVQNELMLMRCLLLVPSSPADCLKMKAAHQKDQDYD